MRSVKLNSSLTIFLFIIIFSSCQKDSGKETTYKYKLTTANRVNTVARLATGSIIWASGFANANQLKFEAKQNGSEVEFTNSVSQHVDVFASLAQNIGTITLPGGTYSEVEFKAELAPSGSESALQLNGTFTSGSTTTPVSFIVNAPLEIKTEQNNVTISDNFSYTALTTLNLTKLSTGITEAQLNAATRTAGTIIISSSSNTTLYNIMLANLDSCDEMEFDHD